MSVRDSEQRIQWMDFLRGAAIVALLVLHASSIPVIYSDMTMPAVLAQVNGFFGPYRMPVLMFLSGMLLVRSLSKRFGEYYGGKLRKLLWPYLVWAAILLAATGKLSLLLQPQVWIPVTYIWFLLFVFLYYCIAPLASRLPPLVLTAAAIVVSILIADSGFISKFVLYSAYFFMGHQLASSERARKLCARLSVRVAMLVLTVGLNIGIRLLEASGVDVPSVASIATSVTGILAAVGWAAACYRSGGAGRPIEWIGKNSIVFYLAHYPVMVGVGAALALTGVGHFWPHFVANLGVSIVLCGLLAPLSRRWPVRVLFELPGQPQRVLQARVLKA